MKVGIAGLGTIGKVVARALDEDRIEGLELVGVAVRDSAKAALALESFRHRVPVLTAQELADAAEIVVECVPKAAFRGIAEPALEAGRILVTVSGGLTDPFAADTPTAVHRLSAPPPVGHPGGEMRGGR